MCADYDTEFLGSLPLDIRIRGRPIPVNRRSYPIPTATSRSRTNNRAPYRGQGREMAQNRLGIPESGGAKIQEEAAGVNCKPDCGTRPKPMALNTKNHRRHLSYWAGQTARRVPERRQQAAGTAQERASISSEHGVFNRIAACSKTRKCSRS
jgi:hypothetical protein